MKKVMCAGTFDTVHPGHLHYLSDAKDYGDYLVVVVARDDRVEKIKGKKPIHSEKERLTNIRSLDLVNEAKLGNLEGSIFDIVEEIKPDYIALGYDQRVEKQDLDDELKKRNIKCEVVRIGSFKPHVYKSSKINKSSTDSQK